jgi:hypothetical protein
VALVLTPAAACGEEDGAPVVDATRPGIRVDRAGGASRGTAGASRGGETPVVPPLATLSPRVCDQYQSWSTGKVLAYRAAIEESHELWLDETQLDTHARELDNVLQAVETAYPDTPPAVAWVPFVPRNVIIGLKTEFADTLDPALFESFATHPPQSFGLAELDDFNESLGLKATSFTGLSDNVAALLCFDELVNPIAASDELSKFSELNSAEPNHIGGIGIPGDTVIREQDGKWYVVIREPFDESSRPDKDGSRYYFIVSPSSTQRLDEQTALADPLLTQLSEELGP